jgi:hypothetical protein
MRYVLSCLFVIFFSQNGFSGVYLYNNTPFILNAKVMAANGTEIGGKQLQPEETKYLEDQLGSSNPVGTGDPRSFQNYKESMTPYQVFWYCTEGDQSLYATCTAVAAGATVMAASCTGPCYCQPPKKEKKQAEDTYKAD